MAVARTGLNIFLSLYRTAEAVASRFKTATSAFVLCEKTRSTLVIIAFYSIQQPRFSQLYRQDIISHTYILPFTFLVLLMDRNRRDHVPSHFFTHWTMPALPPFPLFICQPSMTVTPCDHLDPSVGKKAIKEIGTSPEVDEAFPLIGSRVYPQSGSSTWASIWPLMSTYLAVYRDGAPEQRLTFLKFL
ncbi:hypothetical protein BJ165DRAFT_684073 [Panaeolus papilionaceus]|nr:hypothetical protein BJ165DRAFT_684073 [Panaeolus papilionaceus]